MQSEQECIAEYSDEIAYLLRRWKTPDTMLDIFEDEHRKHVSEHGDSSVSASFTEAMAKVKKERQEAHE